MASPKGRGLGFLVFFLACALAVAFFYLQSRRGLDESAFFELLPADSVALVHVSNPTLFAKQIDSAAVALGVDPLVGAYRSRLDQQLGVDPFEEDELRRFGIDPSPGIVAYSPPPGRFFVLVVALRDKGSFESNLMGVFSDRTGAERGEDREVDGVSVRVAERRGRPLAAWAYLGDYAFISAGADCIGRVAAGANPRKNGIIEELWFRRALDAVGGDTHLFAWSSGEGLNRVFRQRRANFEAMAIGLRLEDRHLGAKGWVGLDAPLRNLLDPFKVNADFSSILSVVNPEAILAGRVKVDLRSAWGLLRLGGLPPALEEFSSQLIARGIRVDREVLPLLDGSFVVDAGFVDKPQLGSIRRLDPRRLNPFLYVRTALYAPLNDQKKAEEMMPDLAEAVAMAVGGRLEETKFEDKKAYEIHYRLGKGMTFGIDNGFLVVTGGEGEYPRALERVNHPGKGIDNMVRDKEAKQAFSEEGAAAALISVFNLVQTVEGMGADSFGGGPTGMMLRHMVNRYLEPVSRLNLVMGTVGVDDFGVYTRFEVGFEPAQ